MAFLNGVIWDRPFETTYGKLVVSKVILFSVALGIASINQFIHLNKWNAQAKVGPLREMRREVLFELFLVALVFILAGFLARSALP